MLKKKRRNKTERRGVAVAELAVCLPLLVLLCFGTIEASGMFFLKQSLSIASYEAARVSLIPEITTDDAKYQAELILANRRVVDFSVTVTPDVESAAVGDFIAVTTSAPCDSNSIIGSFFFGGRQLESTVAMRKEY